MGVLWNLAKWFWKDLNQNKSLEVGSLLRFRVSSFNQFASKIGYVILKFCFYSFLILSHPWWDIRGWNIELTFAPSLQIRPEDMCDTVFEKAKGPSETVSITSDYEKIYKRFYKKDVREISQNFQEIICARVIFLIKFNIIDLQLH